MGEKPCGRRWISYGPSRFGFAELNEPGYYEEDDEISAVMKL
jgi:hypothetical protein